MPLKRSENVSGERHSPSSEELLALIAFPAVLQLWPQDRALLDGAMPFRFGASSGNPAWSVGEGPVVALVHGWGGRGSQMAGLAHFLAAEGYRCVFFDASGHGDAPAGPVGFDTLMHDVAEFGRHLGDEIHCWIGHSGGALAMMAAYARGNISAAKFVCIAAPSHPYPTIDALRRKTNVSDVALASVRRLLARQFATSWGSLAGGGLYRPKAAESLLLVYDIDDKRVRHSDAVAIAAHWPGAEVFKTATYGHNRILQGREVWQRVRDFVMSRWRMRRVPE